MRTIIINSPEDDRMLIVAVINTHPDRHRFLPSQNDLNPDVIAGPYFGREYLGRADSSEAAGARFFDT